MQNSDQPHTKIRTYRSTDLPNYKHTDILIMLNKLKFIKNVTDNIQDRIDSLSARHLKQRIDLLDEADIADVINSDKSKRNRLRIFSLVSNELKGEVLILLNRKIRERILNDFSEKRLIKIINQLNSDDAADLLAEIAPPLRKKIMIKVDPDHAINIASLMKYPPDTAGGIMQAEILTVKSTDRIEDSINILQEYENIETVNDVFVVDANNKYVGTVNVWNLISAPQETTIEDVCNKSSVVVDAYMDQEEVAEVFQKYDVVTVGVVNYDNTLLGKVMVDDIVDVIHSEAQEDMMKMAGITESEFILEESIFYSIKSRFPWLLGAVIGGLVTGAVLFEFKSIIETVIVLATFIPVVMATAGNVATQSSTIMVRRIAVGETKNMKTSTLIMRELGIGVGIGLLSASFVALFAFFFKNALALGLVVGAAMLAAVLTGAIIGVVTPLLFKRINIDPAVASGPMVSAINDFTGILIYLLIASHFINYLR